MRFAAVIGAVAALALVAGIAGAESRVTVRGDRGYKPVRLERLTKGASVDLGEAKFRVAFSRNGDPDGEKTCKSGKERINRYPFAVERSKQVRVKGGLFAGEAPLRSDWVHTYCNSAAIRIEDSPGASLSGHRLRRVWDGIRIDDGTKDFSISGVWMSEVRDDCVENDDLMPGVISDSLFDGCFAGISVSPTRKIGRKPVVRLEGVLMRMEEYVYKGQTRHAMPVKMQKSGPRIEIFDSVIAVSSGDIVGGAHADKLWKSLRACANNRLLWLGKGPLPEEFAKLPDCFEVLTGREARETWKRERRRWIEDHPSVSRFETDRRST